MVKYVKEDNSRDTIHNEHECMNTLKFTIDSAKRDVKNYYAICYAYSYKGILRIPEDGNYVFTARNIGEYAEKIEELTNGQLGYTPYIFFNEESGVGTSNEECHRIYTAIEKILEKYDEIITDKGYEPTDNDDEIDNNPNAFYEISDGVGYVDIFGKASVPKVEIVGMRYGRAPSEIKKYIMNNYSNWSVEIRS